MPEVSQQVYDRMQWERDNRVAQLERSEAACDQLRAEIADASAILDALTVRATPAPAEPAP